MKGVLTGGFFELEVPEGTGQYHKNAYGLSNGRASFTVILLQTQPAKVYVPFYTCDTLLEPLHKLNIAYEFYPVTSVFEPASLPELKLNELFVYINYFGTQTGSIKNLVMAYRDQLVIDNTQAFFETRYEYGWSFNSARKFFGVPDGSYLYSNQPLNTDYPVNRNFITDHLIFRLDGRQEEAYHLFTQNEKMQDCDPRRISQFSQQVLSGLPYEQIKAKRKRNFSLYQQQLKQLNRLQITQGNNIPFCYPFLPAQKADISKLYKQNIFIPALWPDVLLRENADFEFENLLSAQMLPLPVDHRLDEDDVERVIDAIKQLI